MAAVFLSGAEPAREVLSLALFSVASYLDLKSREVSDLVWISFGGAGACLYLLEPSAPVPVLYIAAGAGVALAGLVTRAFGQADCLAVFSLAVILPSYCGIPLAVAISLAAPVAASLYALVLNVAYNLSDLSHGSLFAGLSERRLRKALAFFVLHRRREHERFVVPAQEGGRLAFRILIDDESGFAENFRGYVSSALPLVPFMLFFLILVFVWISIIQ